MHADYVSARDINEPRDLPARFWLQGAKRGSPRRRRMWRTSHLTIWRRSESKCAHSDDARQLLLINPVLPYLTNLGCTCGDICNAIAANAIGNVYAIRNSAGNLTLISRLGR